MVFPETVTFAAATSRTAVPSLAGAPVKPLPWMVLAVTEPPAPANYVRHAVLRNQAGQFIRRTDRACRNVHRHGSRGDEAALLVAADGRPRDGDCLGGPPSGVGFGWLRPLGSAVLGHARHGHVVDRAAGFVDENAVQDPVRHQRTGAPDREVPTFMVVTAFVRTAPIKGAAATDHGR